MLTNLECECVCVRRFLIESIFLQYTIWYIQNIRIKKMFFFSFFLICFEMKFKEYFLYRILMVDLMGRNLFIFHICE